ncbi:AlbA family DNA-binding domain-containing protein [Streptosporangium sp. NPDC003464]
MLYSPRRLEALLGVAPLQEVTYQHIVALEGNADAREADDLDYKREYVSGDRDRSEKGNDDIAVDIATFANHVGGVIIVGMAEKAEVPTKVLDIEFGQAESRIRQAAASRIHPMPNFGVLRVDNPNDPGKGVLLIAIPPSPYAPHAVSVPSRRESGLRWPRRHGADKVWMTESEIAAAYRRRLMGAAGQGDRLRELERGVVTTAARTSAQISRPFPLLVVSLVPDLPGDMIVDGAIVDRVRRQAEHEVVMLGAFNRTFQEVSVGHRRIIAESGPGTAQAVRAELHTDGAGTFALHPQAICPSSGEAVKVGIVDAEIASRTVSALRYLARHARDRAGATGSALLRVMLVSDLMLHPAVLPKLHSEEWPHNDPSHGRFVVDLLTPTKVAGAPRTWGVQGVRLAHGESVAWLDDLADDGPLLVKAAAHLVGDLLQVYGVAENAQLRRDGSVSRHAWGADWQTVERWVQQSDIPVSGGS